MVIPVARLPLHHFANAQHRRYQCTGAGTAGCTQRVDARLSVETTTTVGTHAGRPLLCVRARTTHKSARNTHGKSARVWPPCITEYFDQWPRPFRGFRRRSAPAAPIARVLYAVRPLSAIFRQRTPSSLLLSAVRTVWVFFFF